MIGRRGFITGLGCLVAAPAIVRAETITALFYDSDLHDRMFDLRGGPALFIGCVFTCCRFLLDETSDQVTIQACTMEFCRIDGMAQFSRPRNIFRYNYVEDCVIDVLPEPGAERNTFIGLGENIIILEPQQPLQCAAPVL